MSLHILKFEKIPVWEGVQKNPGNLILKPFELVLSKEDIIIQSTNPSLENEIIEKYANINYNYISKPPGSSDWSNEYGDKLFSFASKIINNRKNLNILEIGSGSLYIAEKIIDTFNPIRYIIIDPSIKNRSTRESLEVRSEYFNEQSFNNIDIVFSFNCLEHIPDPLKFLKNISKFKSNNFKYISIGIVLPNVEDQLRRGDINSLLHEHFNYFTSFSIKSTFNKANLSLDKLEIVGDEFFITASNQSTDHKKDGNHHNDKSSYVKKIRDVMISSIERSINLLVDLSMRDLRVSILGACNGLNTLLFLSQLKNFENFYLYDNDKSKVGYFIPTFPKPIIHTSKLKKVDKHIVLISAGSYFLEIKNSLINNFDINEEIIHPLIPPLLEG